MVTRPRRTSETASAPPVHVVDFLLRQGRTPQSIDRLAARGVPYAPFYEFWADTMPRDNFLSLWERCLPWLRAEADRRGCALPDPERYVPYPQGVWVVHTIDD